MSDSTIITALRRAAIESTDLGRESSAEALSTAADVIAGLETALWESERERTRLYDRAHNATIRATALKASAQAWALYAFRHHGDDATLCNGLADLGGVSRDGAGWDHASLTGDGIVRHDEIGGKD